MENRSALGLDAALPDSGLAVYHCDCPGSDEWQGDGTNYRCCLLQADGSLDLETSAQLGDRGDLFGRVAGVALSHDTPPSSLLRDGSDSGLIISDISEPGRVIAFVVGREERGAVRVCGAGRAIPLAAVQRHSSQSRREEVSI